jgi:hypothetical protein
VSIGHSVGPQGPARPVLVVLGTLAAEPERAALAAARFADAHGGLDLEGEVAAFNATDYYEPEMGPDLTRRFWSCRTLAPADHLVSLKQQAWVLEQELAEHGRRPVNLDPGILDHGKVVLASFKPAPQKLYLGHGIWADTLLHFQRRAFHPLPWTFPDLREGPHVRFFERARQRYSELLRGPGAG